MYRELLAQYIENHDYAELQEPCPEAEIEKAEQFLGFPFPDALKNLLRETNGDRWFLLSAAQIMEIAALHREYLSDCFDDPEEFLEKVGRHIFFATNGCGDYYGYRILPNGEADTSALYIWEHETFEHQIVAENIPDLITKYYTNKI